MLYITSKEVEAVIGTELALRLCEWIRNHTPITCMEEKGHENFVRFDIDEAMEFAKIKMQQDEMKREFFPHFVKMKQYMVLAAVPEKSFY
jgi:hypothetical protein